MENRTTDIPTNGRATAQEAIEKAMRSFGEKNRWESMYLFSSEGLLMANEGCSEVYREENLLEFAFSLIGTVQLLGKDIPVKEIVIRGREKRRLIFRYVEAWGEPVVLAAVVLGKKGYRRAMNRVVKRIQETD